ncbi:MAG: hypothetical protein AAGJ70_02500 [Pseudomonadota bacterium]
MRFNTEVVRCTGSRVARAMSGMGSVLVAAVLTSTAIDPASSAPRAALDGEAVHDLVAGARINLHTPIGTKIPVEYGIDGSLAARTSGMAAWYLGAKADTGKWWVKGHRLCQKWNVWFKRETKCVEIRRRGTVFHVKDLDGETGTASLARPGVASTRQRIANRTTDSAGTAAEQKPRAKRRLRQAYTLGVAGNTGTPEALAAPKNPQPIVRNARTKVSRIPRPREVRRNRRKTRQVSRLIPPLPVRAIHRIEQVKTSSWSPSRRRKAVRSFRSRKSLRSVFERNR